MKKLIVVMAVGLLLIPATVYAESQQAPTNPPPVSQPLVPEGDFALQLVTALKLGTATTEAQAEDMLTSVDIAPRNGWIADYPMTPIIIGEIQSAVVAAAAAKKLPMEEDEALKAFQGLTTEFGLAVVPGSGQYAESQPPTGSEYVQPTVVNNYYYKEGPPVVTYYPPPWDYTYLYAWVPYPFWCSGFFFPGFFVLNDFDIVVGNHHGHHHHHITNHFIDPKTHTVLRVDPTTRTIGRTAKASLSPNQGFNSTEARKGAASIFERSRTRQMAPTHPTLGDPSREQVPMNRGQGQPSMIERGTIQNRGSRNLGSSSVPNNVQRQSEGFSRSLGAPSRSFSAPRSSFGGLHGGSFGGFHGGGFSGGVSHGGFSGGGCRGRC
jgi:hypothetical protein